MEKWRKAKLRLNNLQKLLQIEYIYIYKYIEQQIENIKSKFVLYYLCFNNK